MIVGSLKIQSCLSLKGKTLVSIPRLTFSSSPISYAFKNPFKRSSKTEENLVPLTERERELINLEAYHQNEKLRNETERKIRNCNKTKLSDSHRRELHGLFPNTGIVYVYDSTHESKAFKKEMFGRYGYVKTQINPSVCWPTPAEIEDTNEFESVFYDGQNLTSLMRREKDKREREREEIVQKEESIQKNMVLMKRQLKDWRDRIERKNREAEKERLKRLAILSELKAEFGYEVDPSLPHFAQKVQEKEKDLLKREREEKKLKRSTTNKQTNDT